MIDYRLTRREFVKGCCSAALVGTAGSSLMFADDAIAAANSYDTVVHLFLRGGLDGLNLVLPVSGDDRTYYEQARPNLAIANSGTYGALPLTLSGGAATGFGLHPSATGLHGIWNEGKLAIVHACGLATTVTRSHFDAQLFIDLGTPGRVNSGTGWMARAWDSRPVATPAAILPALGVSGTQPLGLSGSKDALTVSSARDFGLNSGASQWQKVRTDSPAGFKGMNETLAEMWAGRTGIELDGKRAEQALATIASQSFAALPATWPTGGFAEQLWTIAQSIRFNLGLRFATLDLGGWDTHENQGTAGANYSYYQNKINELSSALAAFYNELNTTGQMSRVTVIIQSEFGRRVRENANRGTDHGYGNPLLVLGGAVNGRKLYGSWPGLNPTILSPTFGDVPVTTDYRRVFSEIMVRRMANPQLGTIFPGYTGYSPLGIVQGTDLAIQGMAASAMASSAVAATGQSMPGSGVVDSTTSSMQPVAPDWQLRGRGDRVMTRRER